MARASAGSNGSSELRHQFAGADQLRLIADSLPVLISYLDADGRYVFTNAAHEQTVGVDRDSIIGLHVDDVLGKLLSPDVYATIKRHMATALGGRQVEYELEYRSLAGENRWVNGIYIPHRVPLRDGDDAVAGIFALVTDITERLRWEKMHRGEAAVLEYVASGKPLDEVLRALVLQIEAQSEGMLGSVLILDDAGEHLTHGAAPGLPDAYNGAINGVAIGPNVGSCGTATFRGERVIVEDIETDPLWTDFRDVAREHGLRACWSQPIRGVSQKILGSFAMYYKSPRRPSEADFKLIESAAHVAGIAIERTRSEAALRHEQQLLQTLMDNAPDAIYFKDRASRFVRINRAQSSYLRLERPEDAIGKSDVDFFAPETAAAYLADERQVIATGEPIIGRIEHNGADTDRRWFSTTKVPYRKSDGTIVGTIGVSRDITELKSLEAALRRVTEEVEAQVRERTKELRTALAQLRSESTERQRAEAVLQETEDRHRLLHEGVRYVAWEYDQHSQRFGFVGQNAEDLLGFSRTEWQEPGFWRERLHPADRHWVIEFSRERCEAKRDHEFEYRMVRKCGETVWIKDLTTIVDYEGGSTTRTRGIFIDVTARKLAEEQAKQNQSKLERVSHLSTIGLMAASLSHELNQPLQAIMTFAETCCRELDEQATDTGLVREDLHHIVRHAQRAADIMRRLRNFARSEPPRPARTDVNAMLRDVLELLDPAARQVDVAIETKLAKGLPQVPVDPLQFHQVLHNVANNGIQAMAMATESVTRRVLTLETRQADDSAIEITVRDTGPGLSPGTLAQVFEPFYTTKSSGMGLGLSLAQRIVEMHGGRIHAANGATGGAVFTIWVPQSRRMIEG